jgi:fused signal recognition particle receptor
MPISYHDIGTLLVIGFTVLGFLTLFSHLHHKQQNKNLPKSPPTPLPESSAHKIVETSAPETPVVPIVPALNIFEKTKNKWKELFLSVQTKTDNSAILEEIFKSLISCDVDVQTALYIKDTLATQHAGQTLNIEVLKQSLIQLCLNIFNSQPAVNLASIWETDTAQSATQHILWLGVNGAGKTTTISKVIYAAKQNQKTVQVIPGDTFRAGATEQLFQWSERLGATFFQGTAKDPAALSFSGIKQAITGNIAINLIDTSGRLPDNQALMDELMKIYKTSQSAIDKTYAGMGTETPASAVLYPVLVLDGSQGQHSLQQAKKFLASIPLYGVVMTKLDGSSKGGMLLSIVHTLKIPIVGVSFGENPTDFASFDAENFVQSLFG